MENKLKIYKIKFKEYDEDEAQILEVRTKDILFTVEQLGRNRHIETMDYREIVISGDTDEDTQ